MSSFTPLAVVLCEEVRKEDSGQAILVGALNRGPAVNSESTTELRRLAVYIEAKFTGIELVEFRLSHSDTGEVLLESSFEFSLAKDFGELPDNLDPNKIEVNSQLVVNKEGVNVPRAGDYVFEYKIDGGDWKFVRTWEFPPVAG
ncbi:hypothetical protein [Aliiroseovarius marinus]|uniref:hypothetical protein n=1 Tax=Aliiroseovarius marinus TaxID=2500159 RepID=UPI00249528B6|nr:hypothetical protein [Aliiroseovarius marinus]